MQLRQAMWCLRNAESPCSADEVFEKIREIHPAWIEWVEKQGIKPLISPGYSSMDPSDRAACFRGTNNVECQIMVLNYTFGTGMSPHEGIRKMRELGTVRSTQLGSQE